MSESNTSPDMPDHFDRLMGMLHGLPDVVQTRQSTITVTPPLGVGAAGSQTFIVQTVRQRDEGDTVFLISVDRAQTVRLVLPPRVTNAIASQRDSLTSMSRRKGARAAVQTRAERGIVPAFLKTRSLTRGKRKPKRNKKAAPR